MNAVLRLPPGAATELIVSHARQAIALYGAGNVIGFRHHAAVARALADAATKHRCPDSSAGYAPDVDWTLQTR